jgi:hypothetical protein
MMKTEHDSMCPVRFEPGGVSSNPHLSVPRIEVMGTCECSLIRQVRANIIEQIEVAWERQCAGWRSMECESCRRYLDVIEIIDPTWAKWDTSLIIKGPVEGYVGSREHDTRGM